MNTTVILDEFKNPITIHSKTDFNKMRKAGNVTMSFGVESANNEGLDVLGKHCDTDDVHRVFRWCREEGVRSVAYIMLAGPHERTLDEAIKNLDEQERFKEIMVRP